MKFVLNSELAKELEAHFDTVTLECLVGEVPQEEYPRVEELVGRSVKQNESVTIRIEGSLATLQVAHAEMEKPQIFSISVADALSLMQSPQRELRMLVGVGQGIVLDKSDQRAEVHAVAGCHHSEAFLQLVAFSE